MASGGNPIGEIPVLITGDWSDLQNALQQATADASSAAGDIANAFNSAAGSTSALDQAIAQVAQSFAAGTASESAFAEALQGLYDQGATLSQVMQAVADAQASVATEAQQASTQVGAAADAIGQIGSESQTASEGTQQLSEAFAKAAADAEQAAASATQFGHSAEEAGSESQGAAEKISGIAESLLAVGEAFIIGEKLKEFGAEALEVSSNIEKVSISLTALTGSGTQAAEMMGQLEELAKSDALSFPSLLTAAQRMTALLGAAVDVPAELKLIADGAAAMGTDIGAAANAFDRLTASGNASARTLVPLGLTLSDLGKALGVTADEAASAFKALDQSDRIDAINTALTKFSGLAGQVAQTIGGQWQTLGTQWEGVLKGIGDALTPLATSLLDFAKSDILPAIQGMVEEFSKLPVPVQEAAVAIASLAVAVPILATGLAGIAGLVGPLTEGFALISTAAGALTTGMTGLVALPVVAFAVAAAAAFYDLSQSMGETKSKMDAVTESFNKWLAGVVEGASKSGEFAAAQQKVQQALDAGAISAKQATQMFQQLKTAQEAFNKADWSGYISSLGLVVQTLGTQMTPAIKAVVDTQEAANQKLKDAKAAYDALNSSYQTGTAFANGYVATQQDVQRALAGVDAAQKAVTVTIKAAATEVQDSFKWLPSVSLDMAILAAQEKQATAELQNWVNEVAKAGGLDAYWHQIAEAEWAAVDALPPMVDWTGKVAAASKQAQDALNGFAQAGIEVQKDALNADSIGSYNNALASLGVSIDGLKNKFAAALPTLDSFFNDQRTNLPTIQALWGQFGTQIQKAAAEGIPAAVQAWNDYIAALQRLGQPIAAATAELAQLQQNINIGVAAGKSVGDLEYQYEKLKLGIDAITQASKQMSTGQIIDLANMNEALQGHKDLVNLVGDVYKDALKTINDGLFNMGKQMADNLLSGQNLFKGLGQMVASLGKQILEDLVGKALKALGESLIGLLTGGTSALSQLTSGILGGTSTITAASQQMGDAAKALSGAAKSIQDATKTMSDAGGNMANTADQMKNAAQAASASAFQVIGLIAAVITAITGIIQVIQGYQELNKLAKIEENTRISAILAQQMKDDAWSQFNSMYYRVGEIWNTMGLLLAKFDLLLSDQTQIFDRLGDIWHAIGGSDATYDRLGDILTGVNKIADGVTQIGTAFTQLAQALTAAVQAQAGMGGDLSTMAAVLQQIAGSLQTSTPTPAPTTTANPTQSTTPGTLPAQATGSGTADELIAADLYSLNQSMQSMLATQVTIAQVLAGTIVDVSNLSKGVDQAIGSGSPVQQLLSKVAGASAATAGLQPQVIDGLNALSQIMRQVQGDGSAMNDVLKQVAGTQGTIAGNITAVSNSVATGTAATTTAVQSVSTSTTGTQTNTATTATNTANTATSTADSAQALADISGKLTDVNTNLNRALDSLSNIFGRLGDIWNTLQGGAGLSTADLTAAVKDVTASVKDATAAVKEVTATLILGLTNVNISAQGILAELQLMDADMATANAAVLAQLTEIAASLDAISAGIASLASSGLSSLTPSAKSDSKTPAVSDILTSILGVDGSILELLREMAAMEQSIEQATQDLDSTTTSTIVPFFGALDNDIKGNSVFLHNIMDLLGAIDNVLLVMAGIAQFLAPNPQSAAVPSSQANAMIQQLQTLSSMQGIGNTTLQGMAAGQALQLQTASVLNQISAGTMATSQKQLEFTAQIGSLAQSSLDATRAQEVTLTDLGTDTNTILQNILLAIQAEAKDVNSILSDTDQMVKQLATLVGFFQNNLTIPTIIPHLPQTPGATGTATTGSQANAVIQALQNLPTGATISPSAVVAVVAPSSISATSPTAGSISSGSTIGAINISVNGAQNPRQISDQIFKELRQRSAVFSQAATRGSL